jgi:hypothetical protein
MSAEAVQRLEEAFADEDAAAATAHEPLDAPEDESGAGEDERYGSESGDNGSGEETYEGSPDDGENDLERGSASIDNNDELEGQGYQASRDLDDETTPRDASAISSSEHAPFGYTSFGDPLIDQGPVEDPNGAAYSYYHPGSEQEPEDKYGGDEPYDMTPTVLTHGPSHELPKNLIRTTIRNNPKTAIVLGAGGGLYAAHELDPDDKSDDKGGSSNTDDSPAGTVNGASDPENGSPETEGDSSPTEYHPSDIKFTSPTIGDNDSNIRTPYFESDAPSNADNGSSDTEADSSNTEDKSSGTKLTLPVTSDNSSSSNASTPVVARATSSYSDDDPSDTE